MLFTMPRWTIHRSTDRAYIYGSFTSLADQFALRFIAPDAWQYVAGCTTDYILERMKSALGCSPDDELLSPSLEVPDEVEAIYSYGRYPRSSRPVPVLWEQTFAPQLGANEEDWTRHWRRRAADLAAAAERVVTATEVSAQWFADLFPASREKVRVVPYYLPNARTILPSNMREKVALEGPVRLLFVGKEARRKGLDTLVSAWSLLPAAVRRRLSVRVISAMLDGPIRLPPEWDHTGHVADMAEAMQGAHVLVLPTKREAFGLVLLEAMAAGCMIVTTCAPIQRSIVGAEAGLFVDPSDASALAAALSKLCSDRDRLRAGIEGAHARFCTRYHPDLVGQEYANLLYAVAGRSLPAAKRSDQRVSNP